MSRGTKILMLAFVVLVALSVSASYYRFVILQDYIVRSKVDCDPATESCFVWICNPETDGEEECTGDLAEDTWYYKIAFRNAMHIPMCDPEKDEVCLPFACPETGESGCKEVLCDENTVSEYGGEKYCVGQSILVQPNNTQVGEEEPGVEHLNNLQAVSDLEVEDESLHSVNN